MTSEVRIGNGDGSGTHNGVDKAIAAVRHGNVVDPDMRRAEDGNTIAIALRPETHMVPRVSYLATCPHNDVVYLDAVDDHVLHELDGDPCASRYMHVGSSAVDRLVSGHHQLLIEPDHHAFREDYPKRSFLGHRVAKRSGFRVDHVVVRRIGDCVIPASQPARGLAPESENTACHFLPVGCPVFIAPPAVVYWVGGLAWPSFILPL